MGLPLPEPRASQGQDAEGGDTTDSMSRSLSVLLRRQLALVRGSSGTPREPRKSEQLAGLAEAVAKARVSAPLAVPATAQLRASLLFSPSVPQAATPRSPHQRLWASAARHAVPKELEASSAGSSEGRYEPWLCGARLQALNADDVEEWAEVLAAVARREPVLIHRPAPTKPDDVQQGLLLPSAQKWDAAYLRQHMGSWKGCHVLRARDQRQRFFHRASNKQSAWDIPKEENEKIPSEVSDVDYTMSLAEFLDASEEGLPSALYLQTALVERAAPTGPGDAGKVSLCPGMDRELLADWSDLDDARLSALQREGRMGSWSSSQLFVGPGGTLSPAHYDQHDNLYLQLRGAKHFLLLDPWAAEGLRPFPVHHPYDQYAQVDLEAVDEASFPEASAALAGRGVAATVGPGDVLYIPSHWWHQVCSEGASSTGASPTGGSSISSRMSISLSFRFDALTTALYDPPLPLPDHLELELARHLEFFAHDILGGSEGPAALAEALAVDVGLATVADAALPAAVSATFLVPLGPRDFVLLRLCDLLGVEEVVNFVGAFFAPERFRGFVKLPTPC